MITIIRLGHEQHLTELPKYLLTKLIFYVSGGCFRIIQMFHTKVEIMDYTYYVSLV